jgi:NhaA family Na+:H+ antiporter
VAKRNRYRFAGDARRTIELRADSWQKSAMAKSARVSSTLRSLLTSESAGGLILIASGAAALIVANSSGSVVYFSILDAPLFGLDVLHWINDGLMAAFFLLVGLEIKRELLDGQLETWPHRILPGAAAVGGMLVPAAIYAVINAGSPDTLRGWAIPAATDIAFSLGVLSLLGPRVPVSLRIFLTTLAIIDDLGAIVIIAFFYTHDLSPLFLAGAAATFVSLLALNRIGVMRLVPYLACGILLWFFTLKSGVHATIAGVLLAAAIPIRKSPGHPDDPASPLHRLEHAIQPWVAYAVLPVFGLANAGVSLSGVTVDRLLDPVTLGCILGLFVGKQAGVFGTVWLVIQAGLATRPRHASWLHIYGVSILCGIGFTMSLFIGLLAFAGQTQFEDATKIGVLAGSLLSAVAGWLVLRSSKPAPSAKSLP